MTRPIGIKERKPRETLRRKRLVKELSKKTTKDLRQAGINAGYSKKSRQMYSKSTKHYIRYFLKLTGRDAETYHQKLVKIEEIALKAGDISNLRNAVVDQAKMSGVYKDKDTHVTNIFTGQGKTTSILNSLRKPIPDMVESTPSKALKNDNLAQPLDSDSVTDK